MWESGSGRAMGKELQEEGKPEVAVLGRVRAVTVWVWRVAKRMIPVSTLLLLSPVLMPCLFLLVVLLLAGAVPVGIVVVLAKFWPRASPFRRGLAFHRETRPLALAYSPLPAAPYSVPLSEISPFSSTESVLESASSSTDSGLEVEGTGGAADAKQLPGQASAARIIAGKVSVPGGGGGGGKETRSTAAHQLDTDPKADQQLHQRRRLAEHLHRKPEDQWDSAQSGDRLLSGPRDSLDVDNKPMTTGKDHGQSFWREKEMQAREETLAPPSPGAGSFRRTPSAVQVEGISLGKRIRGEIVGLKKFLGDGSSTDGCLLEEIGRLGEFLGIDLPVNAVAPRSDLDRAKESIEVLKLVVGVKFQ